MTSIWSTSWSTEFIGDFKIHTLNQDNYPLVLSILDLKSRGYKARIGVMIWGILRSLIPQFPKIRLI